VNDWVLYGATGYTGVLLAEEAARRGHRPVLAGRNADKLRALGERLDLPWKAVSLDDAASLRALLQNAGAVLHAAGPFIETSRPMADACLDVGCSYLDITGELPVFRALFDRDAEAKARKVALIPGVGFDVVPSDCLAAYVASKLPGADTLELALNAIGTPSSGTAKSLLGIIPDGGFVRRDGQLVPYPLGKGIHRVRFSSRESYVVPSPIADLVTAWHSTRIPNITVSFAVPSGFARTMEALWPLGAVGLPLIGGLMKTKAIRAWLDATLEARTAGPDAAGREKGRSYLYGKVSRKDGTSAEAWLETSDGYELTRHCAISAIEQVLTTKPIGALAPSTAFGADFILATPGTRRLDTV